MRLRHLAVVALCLIVLTGSVKAAPEYEPISQLDPATRALVNKVMQGLGGEKNLRLVRAVRKDSKIEEPVGDAMQRIDFTGVAMFPDSFWSHMQTAQGEVTAVSCPRTSHMLLSFSQVKGAALKMTEDEKKRFIRYFFEQPLMVLRHRVDANLFFGLGGHTVVKGREADVLYVRISGFEATWYVDSSDGRVIRTVIGDVVNDFSDFRDVSGIIVPFRTTTTRQGKPAGGEAALAYHFNPVMDPRQYFAEPSLWLSRQAFAVQTDEWKIRSSRSRSRYSYSYDDYDSRWSARRYLPPPNWHYAEGY